MVAIAILTLVMQFVDLYWLIYPHFNPDFPHFGYLELTLFLLFLGCFVRSVLGFLQKHSPVPLKDPHKEESLTHHVTY